MTLNRVLAVLRERIATRQYPPGSRIPTREQLEAELQVSRVTVQRALDILMREGFVISRGRSGTLVSERAPHLCDYALVFQTNPADSSGRWTRYYDAICRAAKAIETADPVRRLHLVYDINSAHAAHEPYRLLEAAARTHRYRGIMFFGPVWNLLDTPLLQQSDMPRITTKSDPHLWPELLGIDLDRDIFYRKAFAWFASQKLSRVAVFGASDVGIHFTDVENHQQHLTQLAHAQGLIIEPHWFQYPSPRSPHAVRQCMRALFHGQPAQRPDALLLCDDYFNAPVTSTLIDLNLKVPNDVSVIAYNNFPLPLNSPLKLKPLGLHAEHLVRTCIDLLDQQAEGCPVEPVTRIAPVFDHEFAAQPTNPEDDDLLTTDVRSAPIS